MNTLCTFGELNLFLPIKDMIINRCLAVLQSETSADNNNLMWKIYEPNTITTLPKVN